MTELRFPDIGAGKCINCGFLGKRAHAQVFEAIEHDREAGFFEKHVESGTYTNSVIWCFLQKQDLDVLAANYTETSGKSETIPQEGIRHRRVIEKSGCEEFTPWIPFLTPLEHFRDRRALRQEEDRRAWQEKLEAVAAMRAEDSEKRDGQIQRVALILAAAQVGSAVVQLAFPDGIGWLHWMLSGDALLGLYATWLEPFHQIGM